MSERRNGEGVSSYTRNAFKNRTGARFRGSTVECRRDRARSPERALQKRARPNAHLLLIRARLAVFSQKLEDLVHSPAEAARRAAGRCRHFYTRSRRGTGELRAAVAEELRAPARVARRGTSESSWRGWEMRRRVLEKS